MREKHCDNECSTERHTDNCDIRRSERLGFQSYSGESKGFTCDTTGCDTSLPTEMEGYCSQECYDLDNTYHDSGVPFAIAGEVTYS